jgi:hypothetical protein
MRIVTPRPLTLLETPISYLLPRSQDNQPLRLLAGHGYGLDMTPPRLSGAYLPARRLEPRIGSRMAISQDKYLPEDRSAPTSASPDMIARARTHLAWR